MSSKRIVACIVAGAAVGAVGWYVQSRTPSRPVGASSLDSSASQERTHAGQGPDGSSVAGGGHRSTASPPSAEYARPWMNPEDPSYDPVKTMRVASFDVRAAFLAERRDSPFADARERTVRDVLGPAFQRAVPEAKFLSVECRKHTCVIDLEAPTSFAEFAAQQLPWAEIVIPTVGPNGNMQLLTLSSPGEWGERDGQIPTHISAVEQRIAAERVAWEREHGTE